LLCFAGTLFVQIRRRRKPMRPQSMEYRRFADEDGSGKRQSLLTEG
jgi:hypothetical protein